MSVRSLSREDPLEQEMAILLQYSCLENSMDRGAWWAIAHGAAESDKIEYTLSKTKTENLFVYVRYWLKSSFEFSHKILPEWNFGSFSGVISLCLFIWSMVFSWQEYWNGGVVCRFLFQWTMYCHNSSLWPVQLGWPCMAWLIASLSYPSPFVTTRLWSRKGLANPITSKTVSYPSSVLPTF